MNPKDPREVVEEAVEEVAEIKLGDRWLSKDYKEGALYSIGILLKTVMSEEEASTRVEEYRAKYKV